MVLCCLQIKFKLLPSKFWPWTSIIISPNFPSSPPTITCTYFSQTKMPNVLIRPQLYLWLRVSFTWNTFSLSSLLGPFPQIPFPTKNEKADNNLSLLWISIALYPFSSFSILVCYKLSMSSLDTELICIYIYILLKKISMRNSVNQC